MSLLNKKITLTSFAADWLKTYNKCLILSQLAVSCLEVGIGQSKSDTNKLKEIDYWIQTKKKRDILNILKFPCLCLFFFSTQKKIKIHTHIYINSVKNWKN